MNETLKYLRELNHFTQTDVADFLGISRQMYIKYENGEVEPPVSVVKKLSDKYGTSYDVIIDDKHKQARYKTKPEPEWKVASSTPAYLASNNYSKAYEYASKLMYDELFKLLGAVVKFMEEKREKPQIKKMTKEESLAILKKINGCIKRKSFDYKQELYDYLDERYGEGLSTQKDKKWEGN